MGLSGEDGTTIDTGKTPMRFVGEDGTTIDSGKTRMRLVGEDGTAIYSGKTHMRLAGDDGTTIDSGKTLWMLFSLQYRWVSLNTLPREMLGRQPYAYSGAKLLGGVGGCDTKVRLAGQGLFLHGKMPANWLRCDEQKYQNIPYT